MIPSERGLHSMKFNQLSVVLLEVVSHRCSVNLNGAFSSTNLHDFVHQMDKATTHLIKCELHKINQVRKPAVSLMLICHFS